MPAQIYEIDVKADTLMILRNPTIKFATWDEHEENLNAEDVTSPSNDTLGDDMSSPKSDGKGQPNEDDVIHYRVSSRHLILASPRFNTMLSDSQWAEGVRSETDGLYHIMTSDWDEQALLILLNILHLRNRVVPREVTLEMLAKIAVLIDYYECAEVVEIFSEMWIETVRKSVPVPGTYCRDLILWIFVAWVFKLPEFEEATKVAVTMASGPIETLGLPIPPKVIDKLDELRNAAIESILAILDMWMDTFRSLDYRCPGCYAETHYHHYNCACFLLGVLTKGMYSIDLLPLRPVPPFEGLNFLLICLKVRCMRGMDDNMALHACRLRPRLDGVIKDRMEEVGGSRLEDFGC